MSLPDLTMSLAGIFQPAYLVGSLATTGRAEPRATEASLRSIFTLDVDSVEEVYAGGTGFGLGLSSVSEILDNGRKDPVTLRYVAQIMNLSKRFMRHKHAGQQLAKGLHALYKDNLPPESMDEHVRAELARLYGEIVSPVSNKIVVHGDAGFLTQESVTASVRALLLAGVRSGVLWFQLGGGNFKLMFQRRKFVDTARKMRKQLLAGFH